MTKHELEHVAILLDDTEKQDLLIDEILGDVELAQGQFVVVLIVQDVHQVGVERVDVLRRPQNTTRHRPQGQTPTHRLVEHKRWELVCVCFLRPAWGSL